MESAKYKLGGSNDVIGTDGSTLSTVYAKGSNLSLEPLDYGDASLVGLWSFNEGTGTVAYDYSGNNSTGTWNGTQVGTSGYYSAGKIGPWAGVFDGSSTYVNLTNNASLSFDRTNTFSLCSWINTTSTNGGTIISKFNQQSPYPGWSFGFQGTGVLQEDLLSNLGTSQLSVATVSTINNGTWNFVCGTYNGSSAASGIQLYINGANVSTTVVSNNLVSSILTTVPVLIGGRSSNGSGVAILWPGRIDDARVYNRVLSASEIAAMYAGGK
jgi:hypothetical protein